jgi:FlaA1/EpsC-like NDP-sugar epimerase
MPSGSWITGTMRKLADESFHRLRAFLIGLPRPLKRLVMILVDLACLAAAAAIAILFTTPAQSLGPGFPWQAVALLGVVMLPLFWFLGFYHAVVRFLRSRIMGHVAIGLSVLALVLYAYGLVFPAHGIGLGTAVTFWAFGLLHTAGSRFMVRDFLHGNRRPRERVVIYGAGNSGARLAGLLTSGGECLPMAFLDDSPTLHGSLVGGLPVYPPSALPELTENLGLSGLLLAMPSVTRKRRAEILEELESSPLHVQTVPDMNDLVMGHASFDDLREVDVEDLLGRDPVPPRPELISACIAGRSVMVTGAGGSIGSELCRQIVELGPTRLVLVDHSEPALYAVDQELRTLIDARGLQVEVVSVLGSVTEGDFLQQVMKSFAVRTIYHAAAYKHVPLVEYNMGAGIRNNVIGTYRAARAAELAGVENFVLVSTDKAVNPTNVMGASKRFAEMILQGMCQRGTKMRICMVRFGNVLASSGSVVPLFREQIRSGGPVTVTHRDIVRYFMTIPEAAQLVIQASAMGSAGEVFLLDMGEPVKIDDLARKMIRLTGLEVRDAKHPDGDIEIIYTGLRPAEKLYEELLITGNAVGTEHPRIWKAREAGTSWEDVRGAIEAISKAVVANDCDEMRRILLDVVHEYSPPQMLADQVWRAMRKTPPKSASVVDLPTRAANHGQSASGESA